MKIDEIIEEFGKTFGEVIVAYPNKEVKVWQKPSKRMLDWLKEKLAEAEKEGFYAGFNQAQSQIYNAQRIFFLKKLRELEGEK